MPSGSSSFSFCNGRPTGSSARPPRPGAPAGSAIGLYRDLAVGVNPNGAEAWADQELVVPGAAIGAPPDALSRAGQNWGLAPINPLALRRRGFAPLIAALRANMRHAGILRIDHVMSLQRLYWIPSGCPATAGAYVNYPFHDLLRLVALESRRQGCAVIGEDLGTVPDGFRETMQAANVLSYRVFVFERLRRRQLHAAGRVPAAGRRLGRDARPRDAEGLLARPRHRLAPAPRALSRRRGRGRPKRPSAAATAHLLLEALGPRGAARARAVRRVPVRRTASRSMARNSARRSSPIWRARARA